MTWLKTICEDWSRQHPERRLHWITIAVVFFAALLTVMIPAVITQLPVRDVAMRYAPMADAFASGNFGYAFHPRIPMLHPLLAGIVVFITGWDGFLACKITSAICFALVTVPLLLAMQRVFDRRVAIISGIIYACASPLIRIGYSGTRDSLKSLIVMVCCWALVKIYQERRTASGYICAGAACGLAVLTRVDLIVFAAAVSGGCFLLECRLRKFAYMSLIGSTLAGIVALPAFIQNYWLIGLAVPDNFSARVVTELLGRTPQIADMMILAGAAGAGMWLSALVLSRLRSRTLLTLAGGALIAVLIVGVWKIANTDIAPEYSLKEYCFSVLSGAFSYFAIPVIPAVMVRVYLKKWQREESLLFFFYFGHIILVLGQNICFNDNLYVSDRYLESALPVLFGWAAWMCVALWDVLEYGQKKLRLRRSVLHVTAAVLITVPVVLCLNHAFRPVYKELLPGKIREQTLLVHRMAEVVRRGAGKMDAKEKFVINRDRYIPDAGVKITYLEMRGTRWVKNQHRASVVAYFAGARLVDDGCDYLLAVWKLGAPVGVPPAAAGEVVAVMEQKEYIGKLWRVRK